MQPALLVSTSLNFADDVAIAGNEHRATREQGPSRAAETFGRVYVNGFEASRLKIRAFLKVTAPQSAFAAEKPGGSGSWERLRRELKRQ